MYNNNLWDPNHIDYWTNWFNLADELDGSLDHEIKIKDMAKVCEDYEGNGEGGQFYWTPSDNEYGNQNGNQGGDVMDGYVVNTDGNCYKEATKLFT